MTINAGESKIRAANSLMNDLIVVNRGIISVYKTAEEQLEDEINARLMQKSAEKHTTFVKELSNMIALYSGNPVSNTDLGSFARRTWISLKGTVSEGDGPILVEVAAEADKVLNAYAEAMGANLPDKVHDLVRSHTPEVRIIYEKLLLLSAAYKN